MPERFDNYYGNEKSSRLLINLTDVQYYIPNNDLYDIAEKLDNGVIVTGTCHVPTNLDTEQHNIIIGDKIEGSVRCIYTPKNKNSSYFASVVDNTENKRMVAKLSDFTMIMQMEGNDHIYKHDLHMWALTKDRINIIHRSDGNYKDFILKLVVEDRYDCGGTQYIRYKIIKFTQPSLQDFYDTEVMNNFTQYRIAALSDIYYTQLEQVQLVDRNAQKNIWRNCIIQMLKYLKEKRQIVFEIPLIKQQLTEDKSLYNAQPLRVPNQIETNALIQDGRLLFTRKKVGRIFNYYAKVFHDIPTQLNPNEITVVDQELINRIITKLITAPKIDRQVLSSIINFVNREKPQYNIIDHIIPLIMFSVSEAAKTELTLTSILNTVSASLINESKNGTLKITAQSLKQAWNMKQLWDYIIMTIKSPLNIVNQTDLSQDFQ